MIAKYKGKYTKLKKNHKYEVYFSKPKGFYAYDCHVVYDLTADEELDITLNYGSELNIRKNNWEIDGDLLDND